MRSRVLAYVYLLLTLPAIAQTTYVLSPVAHQQFFDASGRLLGGGRLWTHAAGTTTPLNTFADNVGTANSNPITWILAGLRRRVCIWTAPRITSSC